MVAIFQSLRRKRLSFYFPVVHYNLTHGVDKMSTSSANAEVFLFVCFPLVVSFNQSFFHFLYG